MREVTTAILSVRIKVSPRGREKTHVIMVYNDNYQDIDKVSCAPTT